MSPDALQPPPAETERDRVVRNRFREARAYPLTIAEAHLFSESNRDIGELRVLKEYGCPPDVAARILL